MKAVLKDIQDGTFAKQWQEEAASGSANFKRMMEEDIAHPIEATGQALSKTIFLAEAKIRHRVDDHSILWAFTNRGDVFFNLTLDYLALPNSNPPGYN